MGQCLLTYAMTDSELGRAGFKVEHRRLFFPERKKKTVLIDGTPEEAAKALIEKLDEIAKAHSATISQVALAWMLADPIITSPIIGATNVEQLKENLAALIADPIHRYIQFTVPEKNRRGDREGVDRLAVGSAVALHLPTAKRSLGLSVSGT